MGEQRSWSGGLGEEINSFSLPGIEKRFVDFPVRSLVPPPTTLQEMEEDKKE